MEELATLLALPERFECAWRGRELYLRYPTNRQLLSVLETRVQTAIVRERSSAAAAA
jgi:hypothetical protein